MTTETAEATYFERFLSWRQEHMSERMFILILAFLVGFFAAVAAFILHNLIAQIGIILTSSFNKMGANWLYLVYPVIGIFLTSLFYINLEREYTRAGITT